MSRTADGGPQRSFASSATYAATIRHSDINVEDRPGGMDPRKLIEENHATSAHLPFAKGKWRGGGPEGGARGWCKIFQGNYFCHDDLLSASSVQDEKDGKLVEPSCEITFIPSMEIRDFNERREDSPLSRRIRTREVIMTRFRNYRTLQIGSRYYMCKDTGPMCASKAFEATVNQRNKRISKSRRNEQLWELMVPSYILLQLYEEVMEINEAGGYATFSVAHASDKWFAVRSIVIIGPPLQPAIEHRENDNAPNDSDCKQVVGANEDGDMFGAYETTSITLSDVTITKPVPWEVDDLIPKTDKDSQAELMYSLSVSTKGYVVDLDAGLVRKVDTTHVERIPCPLSGWIYEMSSPRKSGCSSISRASTKNPTKGLLQSRCNPLILLGASIVAYHKEDGSANTYVRLLPTFFEDWNKAMEDSECLRVHVKETAEEHDAGRKGTFKVFGMDPVVKVAGEWFWLRHLKPARVIPCHKLSEKKHRYLSMSITKGQ